MPIPDGSSILQWHFLYSVYDRSIDAEFAVLYSFLFLIFRNGRFILLGHILKSFVVVGISSTSKISGRRPNDICDDVYTKKVADVANVSFEDRHKSRKLEIGRSKMPM